MAYKRVMIRCDHANDLTGSEQQTFADDVQARLNGTGINGYFIVLKGQDWIQWEGNSNTIENKVDEHLSDSRISDHDVLEDVNVSSLEMDGWRAHTEPDTYCELA